MPPELRGRRVLLIEDNPYTLKAVAQYLDGFGFKVDSFQNAEEALAFLGRRNPLPAYGLVMADIDLPGMDGLQAFDNLKAITGIDLPPFLLAHSPLMPKEKKSAAQNLGINHFISKPIKQSPLLNVIMDIFGCEAELATPAAEEMAYLDDFVDVSILLVEDNPINQRVATEMLARAGIRVDSADNGLAAISSIKKKCYDAVLMDVQMPEMDGLEATRIVRSELNMQKLPIIALTAHTMAGDRDRCLDAGMNDYLAKPIDRSALFETLKKNIESKGGQFDCLPGAFGSSDAQVPALAGTIAGLDIADGLTRLGGDWELYLDVLKDYCEHYRDFLPAVEQLVANRDFATARRKAHALKGAAANLSATVLSESARRLEKACTDENERRVTRLLPEIQASLAEVFRAYETLATDLAAPRN